MADRSELREDIKEGLYLTVRGEELAGYKRELVTQQLSEIEHQLLVCHKCNGFMRDACNTVSGTAMGCQVCVGTGGGTVGTVRTMVSNLRCMCPLKHRGCAWDGTIGEVAQHLEECDCLVVVCPYSAYGCPKRLRRGDMGTHRGEGKEYHTELMSAFTKQKIDQLESAKMVQGEAIRDLQESNGTLKDSIGTLKDTIWTLKDSIGTLRADKEYMRPNGVLWRIPFRDMIRDRVQRFEETRPGITRPGIPWAGTVPEFMPDFMTDIPVTQYGQVPDVPATGSYWGGDSLIGPIFELDSYKLRPQLLIESADAVCLQLKDATNENMQQQDLYRQMNSYGEMHPPPRMYNASIDPNLYMMHDPRHVSHKTQMAEKGQKWPLRGKCKVVLVNPTNRKSDWQREIDTSQFIDTPPIKLTRIPSLVLLAEEYNNNGTIEIHLLFHTPYN